MILFADFTVLTSQECIPHESLYVPINLEFSSFPLYTDPFLQFMDYLCATLSC